ncbi:MAG TPA: type III PLP-dependent enzyme [Patescibacteria group bacterium]|nr:type III PLP-dependent enzyme [Patescibacteria group bacterium]
MTAKISNFLAAQQPETPCLVVDLDVIAGNYNSLRRFLPVAQVFYAVKANPAAEVISMLAGMGSCFDCASRPEIESVIAGGAVPERISFGNTIKKQRDIAWAFEQGVRLFAFDSEAELLKLAQSAPGSKVFCRLLMTCEGAEWPLSRKFGCEADMARDLLIKARDLGLEPFGISFHVGSQQTMLDQWDIAVGKTAMLFSALNEAGIELKMINLGGGLPARYRDDVAPVDAYANAIMNAMTKHFGNNLPQMIVEPGRSLVGDSGIIETEVVLISRKGYDEDARWVYLDIGKFGGLAETMDESIKYRIQTEAEGPTGPVILAGPTCDSADILYEKNQYQMPLDLKVGDKIRILATGAYTTSYSAVNFNGFAPLKAYFI